jgi:hypothetical protein
MNNELQRMWSGFSTCLEGQWKTIIIKEKQDTVTSLQGEISTQGLMNINQLLTTTLQNTVFSSVPLCSLLTISTKSCGQ